MSDTHRPMAVGGSDPDPWTQAVTLQTYTLELIGPRISIEEGSLYIGAPFLRYLSEAQENLNDLLPDGYEVRIREWDAEEDNPQ